MHNKILNPYVKGLDEGVLEWHAEAVRLKTPSVAPDVGMFLQMSSFALKPRRILELGCGIGVSTRYMSMGSPDAEISAVDYNRGRLDAARELSPSEKINFIFSDVIEYLHDDKDMYDMIFVDSMKKMYPQVFYLAWQRLKTGGMIIFDDVFMYGQIFLQDCEISSKYLGTVKILRDFLNRIKNEYRHDILTIGGGVLVVMK